MTTNNVPALGVRYETGLIVGKGQITHIDNSHAKVGYSHLHGAVTQLFQDRNTLRGSNLRVLRWSHHKTGAYHHQVPAGLLLAYFPSLLLS